MTMSIDKTSKVILKEIELEMIVNNLYSLVVLNRRRTICFVTYYYLKITIFQQININLTRLANGFDPELTQPVNFVLGSCIHTPNFHIQNHD